MLKIGEFSKLSRVSVRMLRHYDEIGLLKPSAIDSFTGYRYYGEDLLPIAGRIAMLKDMGFGLAAICELLKRFDDPEALDQAMRIREKELEALLADTERKLRLLETAHKRLRKEKTMEYSVSMKTLPERYVASARMTLPSYEDEGRLWSLLISETAPLKVQWDEPDYCCVVYHDSEYRESDVDVEAQKSVRGLYADTRHVRFKSLPAVTFASTTFRGSYTQIPEANAAVAAWVRDNGYCYDGPAFFIYHVSPHETQNPEDFVTEICYPVKRTEK